MEGSAAGERGYEKTSTPEIKLPVPLQMSFQRGAGGLALIFFDLPEHLHKIYEKIRIIIADVL